MGVIKVGGGGGWEEDRYDDALNATCAAVEEGILPGGGVALPKASLALSTNSPARICTRFYFPIAPHVFNMISITWDLWSYKSMCSNTIMR
jgi:hypothetical protein